MFVWPKQLYISGKSKGYGFVEYDEPIEKVGQIKCAMDWSKLDERLLHCDAIVDSSHSGITFEDLHSTCLLIDNLPSDYTDSIALRELFSQLVKPVYCQVCFLCEYSCNVKWNCVCSLSHVINNVCTCLLPIIKVCLQHTTNQTM